MLAMYAAVRAAAGDPHACEAFRLARDDLFRLHPRSPLSAAARERFAGIPYYPHRSEMRVEAALVPDEERAEFLLPVSHGEAARAVRIGHVHAVLDGREIALAVFWLAGYGGGLFLPFRDAEAERETYGGGRYLLDTVKGADLGAGADPGHLVLDFNYAYAPSCAYDPRRASLLTPEENRLPVPVHAGERMGARH